MIVSDYIRNQPHRALSEFNIMGAYAYRFHRDKFAWVDTLGDEYPLIPPCARQFRSWEGITIEIRETLNAIVREVDESPTPTAGAVPPLGGAALPPAGIEELPNGIWVIKGDTHVSQWVKIQQRLDHDQNSLPDILPLIKPGDVVIDAGAFIGDHTIAYSKAVGDKGKVYAFEPNPLAVECAVHNLRGHDNVLIVEKALGDKRGWSPLSGNNGNAAGAYLGDHQAIKEVQIECLDHYNIPKVDFIKWDIEGCEVKALIGAEQTIRRCHPIMVMEVNVTALSRQGATVGQLFALLESHGYSWKVMQENASEFDLMYDIICTPQKSPGVSSQGNGEKEDYRCSSSPPPVSSPATDVNFLEVDPMKTAVGLLQNFAMLGPKNKARVMLALYHAGLTTKKSKKKKQHENKRAVPDQKDEASMEATTTTPKSRKSKRAGRNRSRRLVSATEKE
jgi:FkbM family methyltransferase